MVRRKCDVFTSGMPWGLPQTRGGASVSPQSCSPLPGSQLMGPSPGKSFTFAPQSPDGWNWADWGVEGERLPCCVGNPMGCEEVTLVWGGSGEGKTEARTEPRVREIVQGKRGSLCIWPTQVSVSAPHSVPKTHQKGAPSTESREKTQNNRERADSLRR